jgi:hypothetical protein
MAEDNGRQHSFIAGRRLRRRQARLRQGPLRPPPSPGSATVWTKRRGITHGLHRAQRLRPRPPRLRTRRSPPPLGRREGRRTWAPACGAQVSSQLPRPRPPSWSRSGQKRWCATRTTLRTNDEQRTARRPAPAARVGCCPPAARPIGCLKSLLHMHRRWLSLLHTAGGRACCPLCLD